MGQICTPVEQTHNYYPNTGASHHTSMVALTQTTFDLLPFTDLLLRSSIITIIIKIIADLYPLTDIIRHLPIITIMEEDTTDQLINVNKLMNLTIFIHEKMLSIPILNLSLKLLLKLSDIRIQLQNSFTPMFLALIKMVPFFLA